MFSTSRLNLAVLFVALSAMIVAAQPLPTPTPTPTPMPTLISKTVDDRGEAKPYIYLRTEGMTTFREEANRLGKLSYRLEHLAALRHYVQMLGPNAPIGRLSKADLASIFKLDRGNTYEYEFFDATTPETLTTLINDLGERGFRYRNHMPAADYTDCGDEDSDQSWDMKKMSRAVYYLLSSVCTPSRGVYVVERKNEDKTKHEYLVHQGMMRWSNKPSEEITAMLDEAATTGYRPVSIGWAPSGYSGVTFVLVERETDGEKKPTGMTYKFLRSELGFSKNVNELARQGYRLTFNARAIAQKFGLMEKAPDVNTPTSYRWVDAVGKTSQRELADAMNAGVRFAMTSRDAEDFVFEDRPQEKFDYRSLEMHSYAITPSKKNPNPPPPRSQEEIFAEFDAIIHDGYDIRDIYVADGVRVLFEKKK